MSRVILWNTESFDMPAFGVGVLDRDSSPFVPPTVDPGTPGVVSPSSTGSGSSLALDGNDIVFPIKQFTQTDFDRGDYVVVIADQIAIRAGQTGPGFIASGLHRIQSVTRPSGSDSQQHTQNNYGLYPNSWNLQRGGGHFNYIGEDPAETVTPSSTTFVAWHHFAGVPQSFVCRSPSGGITTGTSGLCTIIENKSSSFWLTSNTSSNRSIRLWNTATRNVAGNKRIQGKLEWQTKRYVVDVEECEDGL